MRRTRLKTATLNLPLWLRPKLGPLLSKAEEPGNILRAHCAHFIRRWTSAISSSGGLMTRRRSPSATKSATTACATSMHLRATTLFLIVHMRVRDAHQDCRDAASRRCRGLPRAGLEFGARGARVRRRGRPARILGDKPQMDKAYPTKQEVDRTVCTACCGMPRGRP